MFILSKALFDSRVKVAEFEKAGIRVKTVTLESTGTLKESMSFKQIDYDTLVEEDDFYDSDFYNDVFNRKYLFVVFQKDLKGKKVLKKAIFWNMEGVRIPKQVLFCNMEEELEERAYKFWKDIKTKVKKGIFDDFWTIRDDRFFHVRPKARNAKDTYTLRDGEEAPKLAYWINAKEIKKIVS